ncbi:uncharacterized protein PHALS_15083 [Plasmopara halstedii]|uniref:Uncharacterized protein n=1 Tax=Plasmopara halstedii TaxID=4781 RepID=A0A0P1B2Z4_PLAHL|nr:uncharacterized protein PHALS_15083 [Plasmopara halstedii]CEG47857.1 hypothetical protein PHALS_15083 [Plasmopara halstedii]|eukprot:XP_024584226.1 hypothetical protein PHALS_15083 [Plasmopara halstedii]
MAEKNVSLGSGISNRSRQDLMTYSPLRAAAEISTVRRSWCSWLQIRRWWMCEILESWNLEMIKPYKLLNAVVFGFIDKCTLLLYTYSISHNNLLRKYLTLDTVTKLQHKLSTTLSMSRWVQVLLQPSTLSDSKPNYMSVSEKSDKTASDSLRNGEEWEEDQLVIVFYYFQS